MKILKVLIGVLAVLVVGFFAAGLLNPTVEYSTEVEVNKPLKESWAVFSDESKLGEWITGYKGMEVLEGQKDQVGAKYLIKMEHEGELMEMTETITAIEKEKHYAMNFDMDGMTQDVDVQFSAKDENTTVIHVESTGQGKGMMMKSLFAIMEMGGVFQKTSDEMYAKLKALIESNTTDYFPLPVEADTALPEKEGQAQEQVQ